MGVDYYKILGVDRNTNNDDLRRAYRKLALRWHPDKNPDNQRNAEARFKQISEAYDVLCDPRKRAAYDRFGEDSLRGQMPPPGAGGTTYFQTGEGPSTFRFNTRNPADIFAEVFGHSSSFSSGRMGGGGGRGGRRGARSSRSSFGDNTFSSSTHQHAPMKDPTIETKMACSLEDIYKGITKKMKVSRDIIDVTGKTTHEEEILEIQITPGLKEGKKFVFHGKGNVRPNAIPADLAFILDEKPHSVFTRDGNDLVVTKTVTLTKA
ncbi:hypothetical protein SAY86_010788 [Trapa natans]|uniref:J domain-containing protein n=1 Tax=Trapa natans TaxID=22666 RepID=A0AAN7LSU5_TRANT|nr:hypothetical protein SAY86_010788 [Trapa natans]